MSVYLPAVGFALFVWWFSTGLILFLNHLPGHTYRWSVAGATLVLGACLYGLTVSSQHATPPHAFLAFTQALLVWGWIEMTYFMGFITGSTARPCPPGCGDGLRFRLALRASLHHELLVVAVGCWFILTMGDSPNPTGTWTFVTLWLMRWSTKINIFLGVPNINHEWLPAHLDFLKTYMRKGPMNRLFPWSVSLAGLVLIFMVATMGDAGDFPKTATALVATLLGLAILEHFFLVLPVQDSALWNWALRLAGKPAVTGPQETPGRSGG